MSESMSESKNVVLACQGLTKIYRQGTGEGAEVPVLTGDEPAPLGTGQGPSPVQLLCAAVGNCLSDSLLFALRKFKQAPEPLRAIASSRGRRAETIASSDIANTPFSAMSARMVSGLLSA